MFYFVAAAEAAKAPVAGDDPQFEMDIWTTTHGAFHIVSVSHLLMDVWMDSGVITEVYSSVTFKSYQPVCNWWVDGFFFLRMWQ